VLVWIMENLCDTKLVYVERRLTLELLHHVDLEARTRVSFHVLSMENMHACMGYGELL